MSALTVALELVGRDLTGPAFGTALARVGLLSADATAGNLAAADAAQQHAQAIAGLTGALMGSGLAFLAFGKGELDAVDAGAQLQMAAVMATIAISDGTQHVGELEQAIIGLANSSQYSIQQVDAAFRVLGGIGFTTAQILGGLGQTTIILGQAMGVDAVDAAQLLGQTYYIFADQGYSVARMADFLTGAYYQNMMSVSDLTQFMGMAGGTANALGVSLDQLLTFGSMLTPMFGSASSAGASLAYLMRNLTHPVKAAAAEIKHLGLKVFDAKGNFVGMKSIMDQLLTDMHGMNEQQKMDVIGNLFNVRSGRAAMDLMGLTTAKFDAMYTRIKGRIDVVNQTQKDSALINSTLAGSWKRMTTTVHDFFAAVGLLQGGPLTGLVNNVNHLFSAMQKNQLVVQFGAVFLVAGTILSAVAVVVFGLTIAFMTLAGTIAVATFGAVIVLAAVIAGVVLVITHWHQIVTFLEAKLRPFASFLHGVFVGALHALGAAWAWLTNALQPVQKYFGQLFAQVMASLVPAFRDLQHALHDAAPGFALVGGILSGVFAAAVTLGTLYLAGLWHVIVFVAQAVGAVLAVAFVLAAGLISGAVHMMGAEFAGLGMLIGGVVHVIVGIITFLLGMFTLTFTLIADVVTGHTNRVKHDALAGFNDLKAGILGILGGLGQMAMGLLTMLFGGIIALVVGFVRGATGAAQTIVPRFMGVLNSLGGRITGFFDGLIGKAISWGLHLVQNFASGILGAAGSVANAVGNIAGLISGFLHHTVPDMGPLADDDRWGGHFVENFARGMTGRLGLLRDAAGAVAGTVAGTVNGGIPLPAGVRLPAGAQAANYQGLQAIVIPLNIDGNQVGEVVLDLFKGQLQQSGMSRSFR